MAASAIAASAASAALPEVVLLSGESFPVKFEGTSGSGILETAGGTSISCTGGAGLGTLTSAKAGTASGTLKGCASSGFKCNSSGDPEGEISSEGSGELVFDSLTMLGAAILSSLNEIKIKCTALVAITIKGQGLALVNPINSEVTSFELIGTQSKGKQSETEYWNAKGEKVKVSPCLASINGGTFQECGVESKENKATTSKMITIDA
jgi:hypothetical protein